MSRSATAHLWWGLKSNGSAFPKSVLEKLGLDEEEDDVVEAAEKVMKPFKCVFVWFGPEGNDEGPSMGIAVKATVKEACEWEKPLKLTREHFTKGDEAALKSACEAIGWPWSKPEWYLASSYE